MTQQRLLIAGFAILLAAIIFNTVLNVENHNDVTRLFRERCDRGQIVNGYLRQDARRNAKDPEGRGRLADGLFPIFDCATLGRGIKRLSAAEQACFVRLTREAYWVTHTPTTNPQKLSKLC